jgi:hypothetical protein
MDWRVCVLASVALTSGCATVPTPALTTDPATLDTRNVCRLRNAAIDKGNIDAREKATAELAERGINIQQCEYWRADDEAAKQARYQKIKNGLIATAAVLVVAGAVYAAANSGGGGGSTAVNDYQWDWDVFYNEQGQLVAYCRGVQTGQFADKWHCNGLSVTDARWPGK